MVFSTREMLYLVASLNLPYSLMVGDPFRGYSKENLKHEIERGRQTLEEKRVLSKIGPNEWELDSRLMGVFDVVKSSPYNLLITTLTAPAKISQVMYYFYDRQSLSFSLEGHLYQVNIYHDEKAMTTFLLPILGIGEQLSQGFPSLKLPATSFASTMLAVWNKPEEIAATLQAAGVEEEEAPAMAPSLGLVHAASIFIVQPKVEGAARKRVGYLLNAKACLWWSEAESSQQGLLTFTPLVYSHTAITRVLEYDEVLLTFDPKKPNIIGKVMEFVRGGNQDLATDPRDEELIG